MAFDGGLHIATRGLKIALEGNLSSLVELRDPDGNWITTNEVDEPLKGMITYDRENELPETGDDLVVNEHAIVLRKSALSRVPIAGERWQVKYPLDKALPETLADDRIIDEDKAPIDGSSTGWIKIFPHKIEQE